MPKDCRITNALRSLMALAIDQEFNGGFVRIYSGTRPAGPGSALAGNTLLAQLQLANPAVASESNGVLTFDVIAADVSADATGTASFARIVKADGTTALMDLSVGTADANLVFGTVSFVAGAVVELTAFSVAVAAASAQ